MRTRELTEKNVGLYQLKREDILNILETKPIEWLKKINIKSLQNLANQVNLYLYLDFNKDKSDYLISKNIKVHFNMHFVAYCEKSFKRKMTKEYRYTNHLLKNAENIFKDGESLDYIGEQHYFENVLFNYNHINILKNRNASILIFNNKNHKKYYNKQNLALLFSHADIINLNGNKLIDMTKNMFSHLDVNEKKNFFKDASCEDLKKILLYIDFIKSALSKKDNELLIKGLIKEINAQDLGVFNNLYVNLFRVNFYEMAEEGNFEGELTEDIIFMLDRLLMETSKPLEKLIKQWNGEKKTVPEKLIENIVPYLTTNKKEQVLIKAILVKILKTQTIENKKIFAGKTNKDTEAFKNVLRILDEKFPIICSKNSIIKAHIEKIKLSIIMENKFERNKKPRI